jgi:hypothetical protein
MKIITWVDLQGRYRTTAPAYTDKLRPSGETEAECLERVWARLVATGLYGIPIDHPHFYVEDADQRAKVTTCCGSDFRYGVFPKPNREGALNKQGEVMLTKDARDGAWEMDTDGTPKINMEKARGVHMDVIRAARNAALSAKDITFMRAVEAGDASAQSTIATEKQVLRDIPATFDITTGVDTPEKLKAKWPAELPARA